jgi:hypothetical protein
VPGHIEPRRRLGAGAEQAVGREQAREREGMHAGQTGSEQIPAGQLEQRLRPDDTELAEQHHRREQIVQYERRLIARNEGLHRRERHLRKRHRRDKDRE